MNQQKNIIGIHEKHHSMMRKWVTAFAILGVTIISYLGYSNPELFQASLVGGGVDFSATTDLYIPNNYKASVGDEVIIELYAGAKIDGVKKISTAIKADSGFVEFLGIDKKGGIFESESKMAASVKVGEILIGNSSTALSKAYDIKDNDLLLKIKLKILKAGVTVDFTQGSSNVEYNAQYPRALSFTDGKIEVNPLPNVLGGEKVLTDADLYIPVDYRMPAGSTGLIDVRVGKEIIGTAQNSLGLESLKVVLTTDKTKLKFADLYKKGSALESEAALINITDGKMEVDFGQLSKEYKLNDDATLFKVAVESVANVLTGTTIDVKIDPASYMKISGDSRVNGFVPLASNGKIVIPVSSNAPSTNLSNIVATVLTLDESTLNLLPAKEKEAAYKNAYFMLNSSKAAGGVITIGLNTISIPSPDVNGINKYRSAGATEEEAKIKAILEDPNGDADLSDGLLSKIERNGANLMARVTTFPGVVGLVKLEPGLNNPNGFSAMSSTSGDVFILPAVDQGVELPEGSSYKLKMIGKNKDGSAQVIDFKDVNWDPKTTELIDVKSLSTGLLKPLKSGSLSILGVVINGANQSIKSNRLTINIPLKKELSSLILTLAEDTLLKLSPSERSKVWRSAYVMVNSSRAVGEIIKIEGSNISINAPASTYRTEAQKIDAIITDPDGNSQTIDGLINQLAVIGSNNKPAVKVTYFKETPGLIKLTATEDNADGSLEGISTTSGEVLIVPAIDYTLDLGPNDTYRLRLIGKNNDGSLLPLTFNDVKWQPQPVNQVNKTSLDGGLLRRGDQTGTTSVYVEKESSSKKLIKSNQFAVQVDSKPMIEYARLIGSSLIERGARVQLDVKVRDTDTIKDIKDIRVSIVKTTASDYGDLLKDKSATWFTATAIQSQVTTQKAQTGVKENFKIYNIPVEIPQDARLINGAYQLVVEITDVSGKLSAALVSIQMGAGANGDFNADGKVTMIDVITAFQIANGQLSNPSAAQIKAADFNNDGKVSMLDVISIFNQIK